MKRTAWLAGTTLAAAALLVARVPAAQTPAGGMTHALTFTLTSADIATGGKIAAAQVFNGFGCSGGNISPALELARRARGHEELRAADARS